MDILYILVGTVIINFVTVFIVDHSGILYDLSKWLYGISGRSWNYQMLSKPWSCSMCLVWWITLIYLLFNVGVIYALGLAALSSLFSVFTKNLISRVLELFNKI